MKDRTQVLFINKARNIYSQSYGDPGLNAINKSSGLANSVHMVAEMLNHHGISAKVEEAIDNNCIDRLVTLHKPEIVVIEALWVVPEKFFILRKLHPTVRWVIRLHSEIPFLANEGIAMQWLKGYAFQYPAVVIASNSRETTRDLSCALDVPVLFLPNYYTAENRLVSPRSVKRIINISCFGAIRPLKNQLIQAIAAMRFADECGLILKFHINGTRIEGKGDNVYKNLVNLFADSKHILVEHYWHHHSVFKEVIRDKIDVGLQVSFTESYNIVAADHIDCGVPVVTSKEVPFVPFAFRADPTSVDDIVDKIRFAVLTRWIRLHHVNNLGLWISNQRAISAWRKALKK